MGFARVSVALRPFGYAQGRIAFVSTSNAPDSHLPGALSCGWWNVCYPQRGWRYDAGVLVGVRVGGMGVAVGVGEVEVAGVEAGLASSTGMDNT